MSSDLDFDRGDSCGSFEFLSRGVRKGGRRPSAPADESIQEETGDDDLEDEDDEEDKLFCPKRPFGDVGSALPGGQNYYESSDQEVYSEVQNRAKVSLPFQFPA